MNNSRDQNNDEYYNNIFKNKEYSLVYAIALIEHCKRGYSLLSFPQVIDVPINKILEWSNNNAHPEFSKAVELSKGYEIYFWETKLKESFDLNNKHLAAIAKFQLDMRYDMFSKAYGKNIMIVDTKDIMTDRISLRDISQDRDILKDM